MEKKLYRSRKFKVLGGVAGGLGEYFNLDPILMRVIFVIVTLMHGVGILLYIILWIVIPEMPFEMAYKIDPNATHPDNAEPVSAPQEPKTNGKGRVVIGAILIAVGVLFFLERIIPSFDFDDLFPIVLIVIGATLVWNSIRK